MKVLIGGIGNIFMGDDGFGCAVVRRLQGREWPPDVDVVDFGIRGMDLSYALTDGYDTAILIDSVARGGAPGTVYVIEPEIPEPTEAEAASAFVPHAMDPARVLRLLAALGERRPRRVIFVACEPGELGGEDGHMGLGAAVSAAVEKAANEVSALLRDGLRDERAGASAGELLSV